MNRVPIYLINLPLIALCIWFAADIAMAVVEHARQPEISSQQTPTTSSAPPSRSWEERQAILTRNLFKANTTASVVPVIPEAERYTRTKLALKLIGTVASARPEDSLAAVENQKERRHEVLRINDTILGARVVGIDPRRIVLDNRGRREELALDDENTGTAVQRSSAAAPSPLRRSPGVQQIGRSRYQPQSDPPPQKANHPAALFSQARILPHYQDGQLLGIQLSAIQPGSVFEQAGLKEGDTIEELNDIDATSRGGSQKLLQEMISADSWTLRVRDTSGNVRTLNYVKN